MAATESKGLSNSMGIAIIIAFCIGRTVWAIIANN